MRYKAITIGAYIPSDSVIHRLDPRTKMAGILVYVISLFFPANRNYFILAPAIVFLGIIIYLSKIPAMAVFRSLKPIWIILALTALLNLFFTKGHAIVAAGPLSLTREGVILTAYLLTRLVLLVSGSSLLTLTTTPKQVADGIEKSFHFLTKIHVPVHEFAMMMSIAMRFIPTLSDEYERIRMAQMSRGADFEGGNVIERARKIIPVLVPLFVSAIRRADRLALAMDARCYHGGEGRSKLHPLKYGKADYIAYAVLFGYLMIMVRAAFF